MDDSVYTYGVGARNCDEQEETSSLVHNQATESKPTEWTDEKHSLYLKSMETSFVNQLYKSLNLFDRDRNSQSGSKTSKHKRTSIRAPSSQFKVLRDGYWSKIDFSRDEAAEVNQDESSVLFANPWVQHYRSSQRQQTRKPLASCAKDPSATRAVNQDSAHNFQLWNQDSVGTEVTDQNFNDEDLVEEKSDGIHEMKRTRTSTDLVLGNDQVVPFVSTVQANDDDAEAQNPVGSRIE